MERHGMDTGMRWAENGLENWSQGVVIGGTKSNQWVVSPSDDPQGLALILWWRDREHPQQVCRQCQTGMWPGTLKGRAVIPGEVARAQGKHLQFVINWKILLSTVAWWEGGEETEQTLLRAVPQWIKRQPAQAKTWKILIRWKEKWLPVVWSHICTDFPGTLWNFHTCTQQILVGRGPEWPPVAVPVLADAGLGDLWRPLPTYNVILCLL